MEYVTKPTVSGTDCDDTSNIELYWNFLHSYINDARDECEIKMAEMKKYWKEIDRMVDEFYERALQEKESQKAERAVIEAVLQILMEKGPEWKEAIKASNEAQKWKT